MFFCLFNVFGLMSLDRIYFKFSCNGCSLFLSCKFCALPISRRVSQIVSFINNISKSLFSPRRLSSLMLLFTSYLI